MCNETIEYSAFSYSAEWADFRIVGEILWNITRLQTMSTIKNHEWYRIHEFDLKTNSLTSYLYQKFELVEGCLVRNLFEVTSTYVEH